MCELNPGVSRTAMKELLKSSGYKSGEVVDKRGKVRRDSGEERAGLFQTTLDSFKP